LRHAHEVVFRKNFSFKSDIRIRFREGVCQLAGAVGAEIEKNDGIAVFNRRNPFSGGICQNDRLDKLIRLSVLE
jgi:hypothetical protein